MRPSGPRGAAVEAAADALQRPSVNSTNPANGATAIALDDFVTAAAPRWIEVVGDFNVRGGIKTEIRATHGKRPEM